MSKFIQNDKGLLDLTISNIGLFIATAILITAIFSFTFLNDYQKNYEIKNISSDFSTIVRSVDSKFFENKTRYFFPNKDFNYFVKISTEFINMEAKGSWNNILSSKRRFLTEPYPLTNNNTWKTGKELHMFLKEKYGFSGNKSEPISRDKIENIDRYLDKLKNNITLSLSYNPLILDINNPVFIEKIYIFYDINKDNIWTKNNDIKKDLLVIYQK